MNPRELAEGVLRGDRVSLARAITLAESARDDDQERAAAVLEHVLPATGKSLRLGISGPPGVGKSTFVEALGLTLVADHRIAVLAIDPSSLTSGGSILGDKTRMEQLAREERAFIRPSPGGTTLGGVAAHTREAMLLCEAAGHDVVLVETIGVGQSEHAVADLCDLLVLLVQPGAGDELQGIKRGIVELADVFVVTKADGELAGEAARARDELATALHLARGSTATPPVLVCSARLHSGLREVWATVTGLHEARRADGSLPRKRISQDLLWFVRGAEALVVSRFRATAATHPERHSLEEAVRAGRISSHAAARRLVAGMQRSSE